jgi:predicted aspartyl protease
MARAWLLLAGMWVGGGLVTYAQAAAAAEQATPVRVACTVNQAAPNAAETALNKQDYKTAESSFREMLAKKADDEAAHEGLIRALMKAGKVDDAAKDAEAWATAAPESSMAMTALGEVRYREGNPREGFVLFQKAVHFDLCNARAHYGEANVDDLAGYDASGKREIEQAHTLHPTDDEIGGSWTSTRPREQRLKMWADYAEHSDQVSDEQRKNLKAWLGVESQSHASDCRATAASPREATVPIARLMDGPLSFVGYGLDVRFNGQHWRMQLDTGADGILISREVADSLHLQAEGGEAEGGIGNEGTVKGSFAHVASVKVGGLEFTNCMVHILDKKTVVGTDGLIGGDFFARSLLTLDFPKEQMRVAPLPERPGEKAGADAEDDDVARDPYIAPEMSKWRWVYRSGHELLMPTGIVETKRMKDESAWKEKLFILDTGSSTNSISPAAARDVTKVARDESMRIQGISGDVKKVYEAGQFTLSFAGLRLDALSMTSFDTVSISHDDGVEVSGFIGAPALFQTVMHIDYRDNLVLFEYTPKK